MVTKIDSDKCIGCGLCQSLDPEVFELDEEGKARLKKGKENKNSKNTKNATDSCPTQAIKL